MYGMNTNYTIVTTAQHQEDIRRATEFRVVRDAQYRTGTRGIVARLYSRVFDTTEQGCEAGCEQTAQTIG